MKMFSASRMRQAKEFVGFLKKCFGMRVASRWHDADQELIASGVGERVKSHLDEIAAALDDAATELMSIVNGLPKNTENGKLVTIARKIADDKLRKYADTYRKTGREEVEAKLTEVNKLFDNYFRTSNEGAWDNYENQVNAIYKNFADSFVKAAVGTVQYAVRGAQGVMNDFRVAFKYADSAEERTKALFTLRSNIISDFQPRNVFDKIEGHMQTTFNSIAAGKPADGIKPLTPRDKAAENVEYNTKIRTKGIRNVDIEQLEKEQKRENLSNQTLGDFLDKSGIDTIIKDHYFDGIIIPKLKSVISALRELADSTASEDEKKASLKRAEELSGVADEYRSYPLDKIRGFVRSMFMSTNSGLGSFGMITADMKDAVSNFKANLLVGKDPASRNILNNSFKIYDSFINTVAGGGDDIKVNKFQTVIEKGPEDYLRYITGASHSMGRNEFRFQRSDSKLTSTNYGNGGNVVSLDKMKEDNASSELAFDPSTSDDYMENDAANNYGGLGDNSFSQKIVDIADESEIDTMAEALENPLEEDGGQTADISALNAQTSAEADARLDKINMDSQEDDTGLAGSATIQFKLDDAVFGGLRDWFVLYVSDAINQRAIEILQSKPKFSKWGADLALIAEKMFSQFGRSGTAFDSVFSFTPDTIEKIADSLGIDILRKSENKDDKKDYLQPKSAQKLIMDAYRQAAREVMMKYMKGEDIPNRDKQMIYRSISVEDMPDEVRSAVDNKPVLTDESVKELFKAFAKSFLEGGAVSPKLTAKYDNSDYKHPVINQKLLANLISSLRSDIAMLAGIKIGFVKDADGNFVVLDEDKAAYEQAVAVYDRVFKNLRQLTDLYAATDRQGGLTECRALYDKLVEARRLLLENSDSRGSAAKIRNVTLNGRGFKNTFVKNDPTIDQSHDMRGMIYSWVSEKIGKPLAELAKQDFDAGFSIDECVSNFYDEYRAKTIRDGSFVSRLQNNIFKKIGLLPSERDLRTRIDKTIEKQTDALEAELQKLESRRNVTSSAHRRFASIRLDTLDDAGLLAYATELIGRHNVR